MAAENVNRQKVYEYYSSRLVTDQLMKNSKDREVAGAFWNGTYDKRPNILQYGADVAQMARNGVTSFHFSVERWSNPMAIADEKSYEKLRTGWDMVLDIDSKLGLDESKTAAVMICRLLRKYGIRNYGVKFSGRRGFHICMPWTMFPKTIDYKPAAKMYPEIPRIVARFVRKKISSRLMGELIKSKGAKQLLEMLGEVPEKLSPYFFVDVEKDWGNRHMFRAPFSLNEKTWMASIPVARGKIRSFSPKSAEIDSVLSAGDFPEFFGGEENEAADLVTEAMDWHSTVRKEEPKPGKKNVVVWEGRIGEEHFPPCIKNILAGIEDGRKRSVFTLVNFLRMANWQWEEIEQKIMEWNEKNPKPLPRAIVVGQLRWSQKNARNPANCPPDGDLFYGDTVNVCRPDAVCKQGTDSIVIKNPIVYPFKLMKIKKKKNVSRGYTCGVCGKDFKNMRSLNMHKGRSHGYAYDI